MDKISVLIGRITLFDFALLTLLLEPWEEISVNIQTVFNRNSWKVFIMLALLHVIVKLFLVPLIFQNKVVKARIKITKIQLLLSQTTQALQLFLYFCNIDFLPLLCMFQQTNLISYLQDLNDVIFYQETFQPICIPYECSCSMRQKLHERNDFVSIIDVAEDNTDWWPGLQIED